MFCFSNELSSFVDLSDILSHIKAIETYVNVLKHEYNLPITLQCIYSRWKFCKNAYLSLSGSDIVTVLQHSPRGKSLFTCWNIIMTILLVSLLFSLGSLHTLLFIQALHERLVPVLIMHITSP